MLGRAEIIIPYRQNYAKVFARLKVSSHFVPFYRGNEDIKLFKFKMLAAYKTQITVQTLYEIVGGSFCIIWFHYHTV